jgi:hypothetical protein
MDLEHYTILFVILFFVAAEIRRVAQGASGFIEEFVDIGPMAVFMPVLRIKVRLGNSELIEARLNGCAACMGRLEKGDRVRISKTSDGYIADLPWIAGKRKTGSPPGRMETKCVDFIHCKGIGHK